jgi:FG-GAP-like repeat/Planctomycete extracellular
LLHRSKCRKSSHAARRRLLLEQLESRLVLAGYDFGDAPTAEQSGFASSYPTLAVDDGASHLATGPQLGGNRSASSDGNPTPHASGDRSLNGWRDAGDEHYLQLAQGNSLRAIQTADINNDGFVDVVMAGLREPALSVALGRANGEFEAAELLNIGGCETAYDLRLADFNQDGN